MEIDKCKSINSSWKSPWIPSILKIKSRITKKRRQQQQQSLPCIRLSEAHDFQRSENNQRSTLIKIISLSRMFAMQSIRCKHSTVIKTSIWSQNATTNYRKSHLCFSKTKKILSFTYTNDEHGLKKEERKMEKKITENCSLKFRFGSCRIHFRVGHRRLDTQWKIRRFYKLYHRWLAILNIVVTNIKRKEGEISYYGLFLSLFLCFAFFCILVQTTKLHHVT